MLKANDSMKSLLIYIFNYIMNLWMKNTMNLNILLKIMIKNCISLSKLKLIYKNKQFLLFNLKNELYF
jgi:hypothetical protein